MKDFFSSGDIVQVVKPEPCCGCTDFLGLVFTVERVATPKELGQEGAAFCGSCGAITAEPVVWENTVVNCLGFLPETLKRLPPCPEEDIIDISRDEELSNQHYLAEKPCDLHH